MSLIISAYGSLGLPVMPTPSIASTMRSYCLRSMASQPLVSSLTMWRFTFEMSLLTSASGSTRWTLTFMSLERYLAATKPSPPLFPRPHTTATLVPGSCSARMCLATASPACSMSVIVLTPRYDALTSRTFTSSGGIAFPTTRSDWSVR